MRPNADKVTQALNYSTLRDPSAYPLTMVTYAMAPTCGLTPAKASAIATLLRYAASDGANTAGVQPGQLAPGYLPLPAAMRQQTLAVADATAGETRCATAQHRTATSPLATAPGTNPRNSLYQPVTRPGGPAVSSVSSAPPSSRTARTRVRAAESSAAVAYQTSPLESSGVSRLVLPMVLILAAALLLVGPTVLLLTRTSVSEIVGHHVSHQVGRLLRRH
jgi:hypothetical protein